MIGPLARMRFHLSTAIMLIMARACSRKALSGQFADWPFHSTSRTGAGRPDLLHVRLNHAASMGSGGTRTR